MYSVVSGDYPEFSLANTDIVFSTPPLINVFLYLVVGPCIVLFSGDYPEFSLANTDIVFSTPPLINVFLYLVVGPCIVLFLVTCHSFQWQIQILCFQNLPR
jgi:hypothetical protein